MRTGHGSFTRGSGGNSSAAAGEVRLRLSAGIIIISLGPVAPESSVQCLSRCAIRVATIAACHCQVEALLDAL